MKYLYKILVIAVLFLAAIAYLRFNDSTIRIPNNHLKSSNTKTIVEDLFQGTTSVNKPIGWSTDSQKLYFVSYYQDEAAPVEIWELENGRRTKIAELSYREEYNNNHLGVSVRDFVWSPAGDKLGFILEFGWGDFYQLVIVDEKKREISSSVDHIVDFDWHPSKNQLILVKKTRPETLNTVAMIYDLENNQLKEAQSLPQNISSIAYSKNGNLYYAMVDSAQVYKLEDTGPDKLIGQGLTLLPSLDRESIALIIDSHISWIYKNDLPETVSVYSSNSQQINKILSGEDIYNISWGINGTIQLVTPKNIFYFQKDKKNAFKVDASNPSTPSPDNEKFLASHQANYKVTEVLEIVK